MRKSSVLCLFAMAALAQAGQYQVMSGSGSMKPGVTIRFKSMLTAADKSAASAWGEGGIIVDTAFHRYMVDRASGAYFGYDLVIDTGGPNGYVATFQPLSKVERGPGGRAFPFLPPPKFPPPQVVRDGDTIELDLMVSPDGKQRLTDYIELFAHKPEPAAAATSAEPRDFTLDDGPVRFDAWQATFLVNGQKPQAGWAFTGKPGATFWIAPPGQGRYILSLAPHAGFTKAGTVRDNVISFQDGGQQYEVLFMSPIAGQGKAWNLYLLHDPIFGPDPNHPNDIRAGTDRLDNLLPKR